MQSHSRNLQLNKAYGAKEQLVLTLQQASAEIFRRGKYFIEYNLDVSGQLEVTASIESFK